jgi:Lamin Tail Domain
MMAIPAAAATPPNVRVWRVHCAGEYVDVHNYGGQRQNLSGWKIHDAGRLHTFTFPQGRILRAGHTLRIWSAGHSGGPYPFIRWTGLSVWNNDGDRATLRRPNGTVKNAVNCIDAGGP